MTFKINLHCHSQFSDGHNTVFQIATQYKELGFTCAIITDHVYSHNTSHMSMNETKYLQLKSQAEIFSKFLDFSIIIGAEVTADEEEVLLFGTSAIKELYNLKRGKENYRPMFEDLANIKQKHECVIILCHPHIGKNKKVLKRNRYKVLDGYERINAGQDQFNHRDIPEQFNDLISFCNSDAHSLTWIDECYNETTELIITEKQLIKYIKNKGEFKYIINNEEF